MGFIWEKIITFLILFNLLKMTAYPLFGLLGAVPGYIIKRRSNNYAKHFLEHSKKNMKDLLQL
jgi:hypothetical protein